MHQIVIIIIIMVPMNQCQSVICSHRVNDRHRIRCPSIACHRISALSPSLPLPLSPYLCILFDFVTLHIVCWNWSGRRIVQIVAEHWTLNWYAAYISIHVYKVTLDLIHSSHRFLSISFLLFYFRFFFFIQIDNSCLHTHWNNMDAIWSVVVVVARSLSSLWNSVCVCVRKSTVVFKRETHTHKKQNQ